MPTAQASSLNKATASRSSSFVNAGLGDVSGSPLSEALINERLRILSKHKVRNTPVNLVSQDGRSRIEIEFEGRSIQVSILEETPVQGNFREAFNLTFIQGVLRYARVSRLGGDQVLKNTELQAVLKMIDQAEPAGASFEAVSKSSPCLRSASLMEKKPANLQWRDE